MEEKGNSLCRRCSVKQRSGLYKHTHCSLYIYYYVLEHSCLLFLYKIFLSKTCKTKLTPLLKNKKGHQITMTEVLQSPSSSSSSSSLHNFQETHEAFDNEQEEEERVSNALIEEIKKREKDDDQLSLLALLVTLFRKSSFWVSRKNDSDKLCGGMDIGWPTNVQHVAHVTFDRFNGFLGLPVEFELEVPLRAPSARYTINPYDLSFQLFGDSFS